MGIDQGGPSPMDKMRGLRTELTKSREARRETEKYEQWGKNLGKALEYVARAKGLLELTQDLIEHHPESPLTSELVSTLQYEVADWSGQAIDQRHEREEMLVAGTGNEQSATMRGTTRLGEAKGREAYYTKQANDAVLDQLSNVARELTYLDDSKSGIERKKMFDELGGIDYIRKFIPNIEEFAR